MHLALCTLSKEIVDRHFFVSFKFSIRFAELSTNAFLGLLSKFFYQVCATIDECFFCVISNFFMRFELLLKNYKCFKKCLSIFESISTVKFL